MTPFDLAHRLLGEIRERPGAADHPAIVWALELGGLGPSQHDEVPWCSGFMNLCFYLTGEPRTNSARARSWLFIGQAIDDRDARPGYDVVILSREKTVHDPIVPGPEVLDAPGHVGLFAGWDQGGAFVVVVGGNQSNGVTMQRFPASRILGIRRVVRRVNVEGVRA